MTLETLVAPARPVTVARVRTLAGLSAPTADADIEALIDQATDLVERRTGRALRLRTLRETRGRAGRLARAPVVRLVSVEHHEAGVVTAIPAAAVRLDDPGDRAWLGLVRGGPAGGATLVVTYEAGHAADAVPPGLAAAVEAEILERLPGLVPAGEHRAAILRARWIRARL